MKLVMTLLVRDSEKLLRENLEFHLKQGVDHFIVTDNRSVDGTEQIIEEYAAAGVAERIWEPEDTFSQGRWVTRMARRAADLGADWVINSDDDEFWSAPGATIRKVLDGVSADCFAIQVIRRNHPPVPGALADDFLSSMVYRENESKNIFGEALPAKIIHRAFTDVQVAQGNHSVSRAGVELLSWPTDAITISHFPIRDFASFERKIMNGGAAYARNTQLALGEGKTWRWLYELWRHGELKGWYDRQLLHHDQIAARLENKTLTRDESVLRAVGAEPDERCRAAG